MDNIIKQGYLKKSRPTAAGSNPANSFLQVDHKFIKKKLEFWSCSVTIIFLFSYTRTKLFVQPLYSYLLIHM